MEKIKQQNIFAPFAYLTDVIYAVNEKGIIVYGNDQFNKKYSKENVSLINTPISNISKDSKFIKSVESLFKSKELTIVKINRNVGNEKVYSNLSLWKNEASEPLCLISEPLSSSKTIPNATFSESLEINSTDDAFSAIFSNINQLMVIYKVIAPGNKTIDFEFIAVNNAYEKSVGYPNHELVGRKLKEVFPYFDSKWLDLLKNSYTFQKPLSLIDHSTKLGKYWELRVFPAGKDKMVFTAQDITELKASENNIRKKNEELKITEEKLLAYNEQIRYTCERTKESELGYKTLFDYSNDAILIISSNIIKDCNHVALQLLEQEKKHLVGNSLQVLVNNDKGQSILHKKIESLNPGETISFECVVTTQKNKNKETKINLSCHELGVNKYYYAIIKDVTEEKGFIETINENNYHIQQAHETAKLGYWSFDIDNPRQIEWSKEMFNILETDETVSFYDFFKIFTHDDDYQSIKRKVTKFKKEPYNFEFQFKIISQDNCVKYIILKGELLKKNGNTICKGFLKDISDIQIKEQQLQQTEKRFQTVLENMPVLLFATNKEGEIVFWNKECERTTKYSSQEICYNQNSHKKIFKGIDYTHLQIKSKSETYRNFQTEICCKDASKAVILWSSFSKKHPIPGWNNWLVGIDISFRNEHEQEIKSQKEFLDILIDSLPLMVFAKELPDLKYTLVNKYFKEYINKTDDEILNKTDKDFDEASAEERQAFDYEVLAKNKAIQRIIPSYDKSRVFDIIKVPVKQNRKSNFILGIAQDITEKHEQEKRIIFESQVHESLATASTELISSSLSIDNIVNIIFKASVNLTNCQSGYIAFNDPNNTMILVHHFQNNESNNKKIESGFFFLSKNEFYSKGIFGHKINIEKPSYRNNLKLFPKEKVGNLLPKCINNYLTYPTKVNNLLIGQIVLINAPNGFHNDHIKAIKSLSNVYGLAIYRKNMEWEMIRAKEKAEESDRLKSAFLANMSHEIRTPMNAIIGFSQLLTNSVLSDEKKKEFNKLINNSCDNLLMIITDIIDISKIQSGQLNLRPNKINLHQLLAETLQLITDKSYQRGRSIPIILNNRINSEFYIIADRSRLKQILMNLLDNAVKFTKEGEINFGYHLKNKGFIHFYVQDTGIGIPPKDQKNIFESFRQTEETIKRTYGGTGLGLAITKSLVEQMMGKLGLESKENKGSTFWFDLPLKEIKD